MPHISRAVGSRKAVPIVYSPLRLHGATYSTAQVSGYDESGRSAGSQRNSSSFYDRTVASSTVAPTFRPNAASGRRRGGVMGNMPLASAASGENTWLATRILMELASIFAGGGVDGSRDSRRVVSASNDMLVKVCPSSFGRPIGP